MKIGPASAGPIDLWTIRKCCILRGLPQVELELADERISSLSLCPLGNAGVAGGSKIVRSSHLDMDTTLLYPSNPITVVITIEEE